MARHLDDLDGGQGVLAERLRRLVAVELQRPEPALLGHRLDVPGGVVPEDADGRDEGRQLRDDRGGHLRADIARRALDEVEAERVGAGRDAHARVLGIGDPADLDADHASRSSRTLADTSGARTSPSPTRMAWAPAATTRSTSAPEAMPLSLTATWPGGISGSRASEGSRLRAQRPQVAVVDADHGRVRPRAPRPARPRRAPRRASRGRSSLAACIRSRRRAGSSAATMSSTASAPAARDSQSWYSSTMNSFRSSGQRTRPPGPRRGRRGCPGSTSRR